ncbi:MAG TPA: UDP-N-acetylmuramoyl-L-alanine--D-glutamate ligase [Acidimicrobiia bacterium]|nr:UDP-N-acetylmuramoyl-L-alanine--D-glutamate ligase [Acidimicrobiia bacterium]
MTRVLVLGAGVSGLAAAALARDREMTVTIYTRDYPEMALEKGFPVASGGWDPVLLTGIDLVVASPGFPERSLPIVEALEWGIPVWSEVEFAWRHLDVPVAAVTGTNGKTTVTEAASAMLEASGIDAPAAGNIGSALSEHVGRGHAAVVVEVSSFQLRFCEKFHPAAAAITNVALDHLDWHGSEHSYRAAKARIFMNQTDEDLLVFDADDDGAASLVAGAQSELFPVSGSHLPPGGGGVDDDHLVIGGLTISIGDLVSDDPTHLVNIASASALALRMGATAEGVAKAARSFAPGPHRRSFVARTGGVTWIDDSKATNTHAAVNSIRAHDSVVLIAGGLAKGLDVAPIAREPNVRFLIGIGEAGPDLASAAGERGRVAGTLERAVELALELAGPGDTVLLAPGCASFDQFSSYEERGDRFAGLVRSITEEARSG